MPLRQLFPVVSCRPFPRSRLTDRPHSSGHETGDVAFTIGNLGYDPKIEDNEAGFAVDIALHVSKDLRLAIEIDGPTHLTCNTLEPTGKTLFKCRMLAATGWKVMSVPINEWDECETDDAKESYILNKLKPHLRETVAAAARPAEDRDDDDVEGAMDERMRPSDDEFDSM